MPHTSAPTPWWIIPTMAPTPAATVPTTPAPFASASPTTVPNAALSPARLGGYIALGVALVLLCVSALAAASCGARALVARRQRVVAAENAELARSVCHSASSGSDSDGECDDASDARQGVARAHHTSARVTPLAALSTSALHAWLCYNELACFAAPIDRLGMDGFDAAQLEEEDVALLADAATDAAVPVGSIYAFQRAALVELLRDARQHGIPHYELRGVASVRASVVGRGRGRGSNATQLRVVNGGIHATPPSFEYDRME
jgi:hypothetical protein